MRLLALIGFSLLAPLLPASAQSFDCASAGSEFEHLICDTPELSRLDGRLDIAYRTAIAALSPEALAAVRTGQRQWLAHAQTVCLGPLASSYNEPPACLATEYRNRLTALGQSRMAGEHRFYTVSAYASGPDPNYADQPDSVWALAAHKADAVRIDDDDPMARILNAETDRLLEHSEARKADGFDTGADTQLSMRIESVSQRRISLRIDGWWYGHGAAHGNYATTYVHVLSEPARLIGTDDIFDTEGWQTALAEATLESLRATLGDILWEVEVDDLVDIVADPARWIFAERGLTIQFQPYEVTAYAYGAPTTTVSWDSLEDFTTEDAYTLSWE